MPYSKRPLPLVDSENVSRNMRERIKCENRRGFRKKRSREEGKDESNFGQSSVSIGGCRLVVQKESVTTLNDSSSIK